MVISGLKLLHQPNCKLHSRVATDVRVVEGDHILMQLVVLLHLHFEVVGPQQNGLPAGALLSDNIVRLGLGHHLSLLSLMPLVAPLPSPALSPLPLLPWISR